MPHRRSSIARARMAARIRGVGCRRVFMKSGEECASAFCDNRYRWRNRGNRFTLPGFSVISACRSRNYRLGFTGRPLVPCCPGAPDSVRSGSLAVRCDLPDDESAPQALARLCRPAGQADDWRATGHEIVCSPASHIEARSHNERPVVRIRPSKH